MRIAFATLGCKINQYDTAAIQTALLRRGDQVVPFEPGADVYVVNSCSVTDRADAESRRLARRARRLNPDAVVIMTGCFAQTRPEAAALREKAKIEWNDSSLQKKAKEATLKAIKNLHAEMIRIDPRVKAILERMTETEP